jgi:hypothetical protein
MGTYINTQTAWRSHKPRLILGEGMQTKNRRQCNPDDRIATLSNRQERGNSWEF